MGRDKAMVPVGNKTLITHAYDVAKKVFTSIIVVSSLHHTIDGVNARVAADVLPIHGSLTGIVSALIHADREYVFVLGCDLPFVTARSMRYVVDAAHGEDIVIPKTEGGFEPMHALYRRSCISPMLTAIERGNMKIRSLLAMLPVKILAPNPVFFNDGVSVFTNINNEEDLRRAERLLR